MIGNNPLTLERAQKYERLAFTFCKMGTTGLIVWLLTPPIFTLIVGIITVILYARSVGFGVIRSRCFLRKPFLIMSVWTVLSIFAVIWLFVLQHPS